MATIPMAPEGQGSSTRPYLIRALHDWCTDNGFTPYIAVHVDAGVQVPKEHVKNNEIVLNVGFEAKGDDKSTVALEHERLPDGEAAERMKAYWRERIAALKGQGMAFPVPSAPTSAGPSVLPSSEGGARGTPPRLTAVDTLSSNSSESEEPPPSPPGGPKPSLKRIK